MFVFAVEDEFEVDIVKISSDITAVINKAGNAVRL